MSLPKFIERIVDATTPLLEGLERERVKVKLRNSSVTLIAGKRVSGPAYEAGFLLAANLAARLYPRIELVGSEDLARRASAEVFLINPRADVETRRGRDSSATMAYELPCDTAATVCVAARGWNVYVDTTRDELADEEPAMPAALLAAVLGIGELFRSVFAAELGARGRTGPCPTRFNMITLGAPRNDLPGSTDVQIGEARLVGAGAIGQAAAHTLALAGTRGTLVAVDHEKLTLSNLQRYVLARDSDVGAVKVDLLHDRLRGSSLQIVPVPSQWDVGLIDRQEPTLVALDTGDARIAVQASLPGPIYNAWTQPADVGWSRHEQFGDEPCLACLYWPDRPAPSRHEQIAAAFKQHPVRILAYLVHRNVPIGSPLPAGAIPANPGLEVTSDLSDRWLAVSLLEDIAADAGVSPGELEIWRERSLADVYQDGICGGALLHLDIGDQPGEAMVPLAHQSAFAGIMLATAVIVRSVPELSLVRPPATEARIDLLAPPSQVLIRPRTRTPNCLCSDSVFLDVYREKVQESDP